MLVCCLFELCLAINKYTSEKKGIELFLFIKYEFNILTIMETLSVLNFGTVRVNKLCTYKWSYVLVFVSCHGCHQTVS